MDVSGGLKMQDHKGCTHLYVRANQIPLTGQPKSDDDDFFEYSMIRKDGKVTFHNS